MADTDDSPTKATEASVGRRVATGGIWVAISSYWTVGFGFIANILLARILSPDVFGGFALAMSFAQLLRIQPKLGLGQAFVHFRDPQPEATSSYIIIDSAAAASGLLLNLLAVPVLLYAGYEGDVVLISVVLALSTALEGLGSIGSNRLDMDLHFRPTSFVRSVVFPLSYIPAFWLAKHNGEMWSLVVQNLSQNVMFLLGLSWALRRYSPGPRQIRWQLVKPTAWKYLRFGITVGIGVLTSTLLTQLDTLLVGTFLNTEALGFYDRAYRTALWPGLLLTGITGRVAFFSYARLRNEPDRLQQTAAAIHWVALIISIPVGLALFITAPDLVKLIYGEQWLPASLLIRVLAVFSVTRPLWENATSLLNATGHPKTVALLVGIQAALLTTLGVPFTLIWGTTGTCAAVSAAFLIGTALMYRYMQHAMPLRTVETVGMPALLASLLTILGYIALQHYRIWDGLSLIGRVVAEGFYVLLSFGGLLFLVHPRYTLARIRQLRYFVAPTP